MATTHAGLSGVPHIELAWGKTWKDTVIPNGVDLDGTGDYVSTPDSASLSVEGDLEIRVHCTQDDWTPAVVTDLVDKNAGSPNSSYIFRITTGGLLRAMWSEDGATFVGAVNSTVSTGFTDGTAHWVAFTLDVNGGAGGVGRVAFYTFSGVHDAPASLSDWTQLGATADDGSGPTSIFDGTSEVEVGAGFGGNNEFFGQIHEALIYDGLQADGGTLVANPRFSDVAQFVIGQTSATTTTDVQGNVWALQGNAVITGSWVEESSSVRDHRHKTGRKRETGRFEAGKATVNFHNNSRQYEPEYASGANFPNVVPGVPIRWRYEYGGYSEIAWTGFVEGWKVKYRQAGKVGIATARCSDGLRIFNRLLLASFDVEIARDNPIAWWKLQETSGTNAVDAGSLAVNGTYTNTPTLGATGPLPNALAADFDDASDEHVLIGDLTGSDVATDFTIAVWYQTDSSDAGTDAQMLVQVDTEGGANEVMAIGVNRAFTDPVPFFQYLTGGAGAAEWDSVQAWGSTPVDDVFHLGHWRVDFSEKEFHPFVDGVEFPPQVAGRDARDWDQSRTSGVMKIRIAGTVKEASNSFDGLIAHVAIFSGLLSTGRIKAHFAGRLGDMGAETFDVRIANMLTGVGWGGGTLLDTTSTITLTAITDTDSTVLAELRRAAASEGGSVFVGKDGRVVARARHYQSLNNSASKITFNTNFDTFEAEADTDVLFNIITATLSSGPVLRAEDETSKDKYGPTNLPLTQIDLSETQGSDLILEKLARFKDPNFRTEELSFNPETSAAALWPQLRDHNLGDRITLAATPPGGAGALAVDLYLEQIEVQGDQSNIKATYQLSPAANDQFWILGDAKLSLLGETTRLAAS